MLAVVADFNQEKAQVEAFSVIVQLHRLMDYSTNYSNAPQAPGHQELLAAEGVVGAAVAAAASSSTSTAHCLGCCSGPSSASAAASEPADEVGEVAEESLHNICQFTVPCPVMYCPSSSFHFPIYISSTRYNMFLHLSLDIDSDHGDEDEADGGEVHGAGCGRD